MKALHSEGRSPGMATRASKVIQLHTAARHCNVPVVGIDFDHLLGIVPNPKKPQQAALDGDSHTSDRDPCLLGGTAQHFGRYNGLNRICLDGVPRSEELQALDQR